MYTSYQYCVRVVILILVYMVACVYNWWSEAVDDPRFSQRNLEAQIGIEKNSMGKRRSIEIDLKLRNVVKDSFGLVL